MSISIFVAGDVVPRHRTVRLFKEKQTEYLFNDLIPIIRNADISVVNFEAPIIESKETPIRKSGPCLFTTKETMEVLKDAGFNTVTLANNHFRDQGQQGVEQTIKAAQLLHMDYVGGGISLEESRKILYKRINNKTVAIINVCENEFSIATNQYGGSNPLDIISVYEDIIEARKNVDYVILIIHGGVEHYQYPTPRMKRTYRYFIDIGADVVVNHHQHCFSGYEIYNEKPIFYGLGNFCFDWEGKQNSIWNQGYAIKLNMGRNIDFELIPYMQCNEEPRLKKLNANEYSHKIESINQVIRNSSTLEIQFDIYAKSVEKDFFYRLSSYNNRYVAALYRRGYIKDLFAKTKIYLIKNLLCCESHKEILEYLLKSETI